MNIAKLSPLLQAVLQPFFFTSDRVDDLELKIGEQVKILMEEHVCEPFSFTTLF